MNEQVAKSVMIVGGASGIGRASALLLAERGWTVIIADITGQDDAAAEVRGVGGTAIARRLDLGDVSTFEAAFDGLDGLPPLAAVVITAARQGPLVPVPDYDIDVWRQVVDVNLTGTFFFARLSAERLAANGGGRLVLFMSGAGRRPGKVTIAPYIVTKAAIPLMVDIFNKSYRERGVRVVAVDPGRTATPMIMGPVYANIEQAAAADDLPAGRVLEPREVAEVVAFLCSERANGVTNAVWGVSTWI